MNVFQRLYDKVILWSQHRHAQFYLAGLSFFESCVLPFPPPDVMLAPMSITQPSKAWYYAGLTTIMSVLGGLFGYLIGAELFGLIEEWLRQSSYWDAFQKTKILFNEWDVWAVMIAGFSFIPFKIFTISAGVAGMALVPFILASLIGRGARFYLVAGLMRWGGKEMEAKLRRYVDLLGWLVVILAVILYFILNNG